jgi:hypothetical protein
MELDKLWQWAPKKLPCRIRHESGNPAGDELRERFAELAGVDLKELLNDMKNDKKKKEAKNKTHVDYTTDKRYNDMLHRSHVLGASNAAISKVVEAEKRTTASKKNTKKMFLSVPESPPPRVLMEIGRERAKPLRLPENEEKNQATLKLEKKLAKQRAQRMAAKDEAAKDEDSANIREHKAMLASSMSSIFRKYEGDMFGSNGEYMGGMLYLSRMPQKKSNTGTALLKSFSKAAPFEGEDVPRADNETELSDRNMFQATGEDEVTEISSKIYCATALCNWARNPANAERLATEGAVRAIILLSSEKVAKISVYCAGAFRYMSEHRVLAEKMIEEKCVNVISEMITSCNDDFISGNLAICLLNLTRISGKEGLLVEDSIVLCFMNLISQRADLHSACCRGLYNLTCIDKSYPMIERVIRALITLSSTGTASVKHLCAAALCNLADLKGSIRLRMVEEGVVSVLGTLARGAETRTRRVCAVILQNLTATKACRTEMVSRNCVQVAYGLSSDQDPIILRCIGLAMSRLALESANSTRVISDGGIMALCNIAVKYPTIPGISQPAAVGFQLLSSRPAVRVTIVQEGSVAAIASLLRLSADIFTLQHGLLALCNLLSAPENHLPIVQQGLVTTLTVLSNHDSELLKDFCALAYFNLSCAEESRKHIVNAGAITSVINLSDHNSAITKRRCAATLCNIATYETGMQRMVADGIIPALVKLLVADDIETVRYGCAALCRLCTTVDNCVLILESGAVNNVVQGAVEGDIITKQFCCAVLSSLSLYEICREPLCDNGIIGALEELSQMTDDVTRQRCLVAYANLSCEDRVQDRMVREGVVAIIANLADSYFEDNQMYCAKALCNLTRHPQTRSQVVKEKGVQALLMICMVRSVQKETKLLCVNALCNLLDEDTVDALIDEGIVGALANLGSLKNHSSTDCLCSLKGRASSGILGTLKDSTTNDRVCSLKDPAITDCCVRIMNHLSMFPSGRVAMVEMSSCVRSLFDTFDFTESMETKIVVARTACNLILCDQVQARAVEEGGLEVIGNGARLGDAEASLHCSMAALYAALEPRFRMRIVSSSLPGALTAVALDSNDPQKLIFCVKALAVLAWTKQSRAQLQTPLFASNMMRLVEKTNDPEVLVWVAQILYFICFNYGDYAELLELGMQATLKKLGSIGDTTIAQCVAATIRCFCEDAYCVNILASPGMIDIFSSVLAADSSRPTMYHVSCALYAFTSHSPESRARIIAAEDIVNLMNTCGADKECMEAIIAALCILCSDNKTRTIFANKSTCNLVVSILEMTVRVCFICLTIALD